MKISLLLMFFIITGCAHTQKTSWKNTKDFKNPESMYYHPEDNSIYISNVAGGGVEKNGKGYISKVSVSGEVLNLQWINGLNAPKGSRAYKGKFWVSDIDEVVVIDMSKATIIKKYKIKGAKFLNDIAITSKGVVYVSDTITSKIHKIDNGKVTTFLEGDILESPNGLLVKGDKLFVAAWGLTKDWSTTKVGRLYEIDLKTKKINYITKNPLGNLDGLEFDKNGDFIVSDYMAGKVYSVKKESGEVSTLFDGKKSLADIGYIPALGQILIPYMELNQAFSIIE